MPTAPAPDFQKLLEYRACVEKSVQAARTRSCYAASWERFVEWCGRAGRCPFPASAETVILHLTDGLLAGGKLTSAKMYRNAINDAHRSSRIPIPDPVEVRGFLMAAQRLRQEKPDQKKALRVEDLREICRPLFASDRPLDIRNRAILLLGFSTALRRCNIVALDLADIHWESRGVVVALRSSKTDQMAQGRLIGVFAGEHPETDAVGALRQWIQIRGDKAGPLFRRLTYPYCRMKGLTVARILKAGISGIGGDAGQYAGTSLRSGFVTSALEAGVGELTVMRTTGHSSIGMLNKYFRDREDPFRVNASSQLGL